MITIGAHSYGNHEIKGDVSNVTIGKFTSIASDVIFDAGWQHNVDFVTTYPLNVFFLELAGIKSHPKSYGDTFVGSDVWIGRGAFIRSGVTIGDGAVIAAHSVVTHDVKPYEVVGGVPAKHIKFRFSEAQIASLLRIQWWNWPDEKIIQCGPQLMSRDIDAFIGAHKC